jgi:hypothetical protein
LTPAAAPPAGGFSTQPRVLDFDLQLGAMKENPVSSQPLVSCDEFPLTPELEDGAALVGFQDNLWFALANGPP